MIDFLLAYLFLSSSHADSIEKPKSAFDQELEHYSNYQTRERWVQINGASYREVDYAGKKYYIKFSGRKDDFGELDCNGPSANNPNSVEAAAEVFHRSKLFVSFLQESCITDSHGQRRRYYTLDPRLGFTIPDGPKSKITNKKVYVAPTGLGFSGDW